MQNSHNIFVFKLFFKLEDGYQRLLMMDQNNKTYIFSSFVIVLYFFDIARKGSNCTIK